MRNHARNRAWLIAATALVLAAGCTSTPPPPTMQTSQETLHARPGKKKPPSATPPSPVPSDQIPQEKRAHKRTDIPPPPPPPPPAPVPTPKPPMRIESATADPDELALAAALQKLEQGKVAYSTPVSMLTGQSATVVARIGGSQVTGLTDGMPQAPGSTVNTAPTPISTKMKMSLRSADFDITPLSTEEQEVGGTLPTAWEWTIVPKHSGQLQLHLAATVELKDLSRDFVSIDRDIQVQVNKKGAVEQFIATYWQWLLGTLGTGLLALWRFLAARKRNSASAATPPKS